MIFAKRIITVLLTVTLLLAVAVCVNAATDAVTGPNGTYATMKAAVAASVAGDTLVLNQDMTEDVIIRKNLTLDLNGFDLNGTLTVSNGKVVTVKDSSTDDFDCADGYGTIKATAGTGKVKAAEGYIAVTEDAGLSYHRLDLKIGTVSLRPRQAGIYFTGNYGGDQAVKAQVKTYGIVMSLSGTPTPQDIIADKTCSTHTAFPGSSWVTGTTGKANGTLLQGIMKAANTTEQNSNNSQLKIYTVSYAELKDGTYTLGAPVALSLREVVETIINQWSSLNEAQANGMKTMIQTYADVTATWESDYDDPNYAEVRFVDYDNSIIDIQTVAIGGNASRPADPVRKGYAFTGWDKSFTNITADITVQAQYIRQYTVTFVDYDGTVLSTQTVNSGSNAATPKTPTRTGYTFTAWSRSYTGVTSDMEIVAQYKINRYTVTFLDHDGSVLSKILNVPHGTRVTPPERPEMRLDWSSGKAYRNTGWKNWDASEPIVGNTTITAAYSEITQPVIAIDTAEITKGTTSATVSVYLWGNFSNIAGMKLSVEYPEEMTLSNSSVTVSSKLPGTETHLYPGKHIYELLWVKGTATMAETRLEVLTLTFSLDKYTNAGQYIVDLMEGSYIIDENLNKITPVIITGGVKITG